jgi:hypothetical protein
LASFGAAALAALSASALGVISSTIIANMPLIKLTILSAIPIIIMAYDYCSCIPEGYPIIVQALCVVLMTIIISK